VPSGGEVTVSLTGVPLLVFAALATIGAGVGTVVLWRRVGSARQWRRLATRASALLLTEVLALATVGLVANKALDIYPSWSALIDEVRAAHVTARPPTALDKWLGSHAKEGAKGELTFTWRPVPEPGWHLAVPPQVTLPTEYFRNPDVAFPVVVAVAPAKAGPGEGAWDDRKVAALGTAVPDAVVVFVRPADTAGAHSLATVLAAQLRKDLRVLADQWVLVGVGAQMTAVLDALAVPDSPYTTVGLICEGAALPAPAVLDRLRHLPNGLAAMLVTAKVTPAVGSVATRARPRGDSRLRAVLAWAGTRLPPALAPPVVESPLPSEPARHGG
jgi:hypothetical protein